ncbi:CD63 antigen [Anopheles cruzii]|uniref:CD63 antigen n=1 Tax=Anopheles cruzii TaxID=68878 RepID=UPI0022EC6604|nr:CD63 antigen [Anopheles cruzii]
MAAERYELNMSMKCVKYMIFVISITFAVVAAMLLSMAIAIGNLFDDFKSFIDSHFFVPPNLLIAIGIILLVIALFGCVGALKECTVMINIYGVLLVAVFILQLAAAITAFVLRGQVEYMVRQKIFSSMAEYKDIPGYHNSIDALQNMLECCGVDGYTDWANFLPRMTGRPIETTTATYQPYDDLTMVEYPETCCSSAPVDGLCTPRPYGCYSRLAWIISQGSVLIATGATAVAFVQILGAICAFMLARAIRRTKTLRATRRWHLQQSLGIMTKTMDPQYTGMEKSEENVDPDKYLPTSPSVN